MSSILHVDAQIVISSPHPPLLSLHHVSSLRVINATYEALDSMSNLYDIIQETTANGHPTCPVRFAGVWIGVSRETASSKIQMLIPSRCSPRQIAGCDSPMDEKRMTSRLESFL
jgi:hypothetical protein